MLRVRIKISRVQDVQPLINAERQSELPCRDNHTVGFCVRLTVVTRTDVHSRPMWKMWWRRSQGHCNRRKNIRPHLSAVALGYLLRRIAQSRCPRKPALQPKLISNPICRVARAGLVRGNASEPARHPEPSRTDAGRHCGIARGAGFGELGISPLSIEEILPEIFTGSSIKRVGWTALPRADKL